MTKNPTKNIVEQVWDETIIPTLCNYVAIPCKSPMFDPDWERNGYLDQAMELITQWCQAQNLQDMQLILHRLPGRTPLLTIEIPGEIDETILLYGHFDKQPEMTGWEEGLGPWQPVVKNNRLYGRGAADDGYAVFASLTAIKALQEQNLPHARCVILIEGSEESGSYDLPYYMEHLEELIGNPSLVIGLDSGAGNYEQLWSTSSLRGLVSGVLSVEILTEGVHSDAASGVVPSSFRLLRKLLSRIEDENTGEILLKDLQVNIPAERLEQAKSVAEVLGENVWTDYPWTAGAKPGALSGIELVLNRTWRPALSITGVEGIPTLADAGNVLRPKTAVMLSMRIPPLCDPKTAAQSLKRALEANPPYGAKVSFSIGKASPGWSAPPAENWLMAAIDQASEKYFGKPALSWGEGGGIPFMQMLGEKFPQAQFIITGVLGPHSNAHGPNEFLDIPTGKKLTCAVADIIHAHYLQKS